MLTQSGSSLRSCSIFSSALGMNEETNVFVRSPDSIYCCFLWKTFHSALLLQPGCASALDHGVRVSVCSNFPMMCPRYSLGWGHFSSGYCLMFIFLFTETPQKTLLFSLSSVLFLKYCQTGFSSYSLKHLCEDHLGTLYSWIHWHILVLITYHLWLLDQGCQSFLETIWPFMSKLPHPAPFPIILFSWLILFFFISAFSKDQSGLGPSLSFGYLFSLFVS